MPIWIWIVLILIGAGVVCAIAVVWSKKSQIEQTVKEALSFKWLSKDARAVRKQKRLDKKQPPAPPPEKTPSEEDKLSFTETHLPQQKPESLEGEIYEPSSRFEAEPATYSSMARPNFRRMPRRETSFSRRPIPRIRERTKLKDQIKGLSPEMKAVVFANLLDSKLDEDDKF